MPDELKPHERAYIEGVIDDLAGGAEVRKHTCRFCQRVSREADRCEHCHAFEWWGVIPPAQELGPIDNPFFRVIHFVLGVQDVKPIPACFLVLLDGTRVEHEFKTGRWYVVTDTYARIGVVDSTLAIEALRALARKAFDL